MSRTFLCVTGVIALSLADGVLVRPLAVVPDPITAWSEAASGAAAATGMPPLRTPITLAILHVAMFDAVSATRGGWPGPSNASTRGAASPYAAAVEAGHRVLLAEFPDQQQLLRIAYDKLLSAEPDSAEKRLGLQVGADVAQRLLASRANDGRNTPVPHVPGSDPGAWMATPPGFLPVSTAFLARVTPFTMKSPSQFRPSGPPPLASKKWAADYNEVKALAAKSSSKRTPEQTQTALFWEPLAGTMWIPTIHRLAREQRLDLETSARFQAAAFAAFADGLIACWDAKMHFNFWRPVTAIRKGDDDGNPATEADADWQPLAVTPNFPEYPAGHTCVSAAVGHTIEDFFQHDVAIPARSVATGGERVYRRAAELVAEVIEARMLLGVHFRSADEDGAEIGRRIARQIHHEWLKGSHDSRR